MKWLQIFWIGLGGKGLEARGAMMERMRIIREISDLSARLTDRSMEFSQAATMYTEAKDFTSATQAIAIGRAILEASRDVLAFADNLMETVHEDQSAL
jgi:hypothetical protein